MLLSMVNVLTPAYGTALNYGSAIRVEAPLFAAIAFTNEYRRQALYHKTAEFLSMGIDSGKSINGIVTHTMRCSRNFIPKERVQEFNQTAVDIAKKARDLHARKEGILIFGDMSVMGDCYSDTSLADSVDEAAEYHIQQARVLKNAGVDALWAETVGNDLEAKAFAQVAQTLGIPLYISVVLDTKGNVLNHMPIGQFITEVDMVSCSRPVNYLSNCSWERQVEAMYHKARDTGVILRLGGFYNNASDVTHGNKQELTEIKRYDSVADYISWVQTMLKEFSHLQTEKNIWISGCCGFGADDIDQLIKSIA